MALDWVSQQAFGDNKTGIQFTLFQKLEDLDFADDMVLLSQKITHMRQKFATLVEQAARVGLKISNEELWQRTQQERIEVTIRKRKWRWIGHTFRKPASNTTHLSLEWNSQGVRRRGRPRRTIQQEYKDLGMSWEEVKRTAKNRARRKAVVEALCAGRSKED